MFTKGALTSATPLTLLGWRFLVAALVMSALAGIGIIKIRWRDKSLKPLLLVSLCSPVLYFIGETLGINHTTASESGVFLSCIPVASLIASTLFLRKSPTKPQIIGILITLVGVLVTVLAAGISSSFSAVGYVFLLVAVVSYALYAVFVDKASGYTGMEITFAMVMAGALVFTPLAIAEALAGGNLAGLAILPFTSTRFLVAIIYQGMGCSVLAFFLSNLAIARIGVNRAASFIGISTVVSILSAVFFLGESITPWQILGAGVILAGVYIANARQAAAVN